MRSVMNLMQKNRPVITMLTLFAMSLAVTTGQSNGLEATPANFTSIVAFCDNRKMVVQWCPNRMATLEERNWKLYFSVNRGYDWAECPKLSSNETCLFCTWEDEEDVFSSKRVFRYENTYKVVIVYNKILNKTQLNDSIGSKNAYTINTLELGYHGNITFESDAELIAKGHERQITTTKFSDEPSPGLSSTAVRVLISFAALIGVLLIVSVIVAIILVIKARCCPPMPKPSLPISNGFAADGAYSPGDRQRDTTSGTSYQVPDYISDYPETTILWNSVEKDCSTPHRQDIIDKYDEELTEIQPMLGAQSSQPPTSKIENSETSFNSLQLGHQKLYDEDNQFLTTMKSNSDNSENCVLNTGDSNPQQSELEKLSGKEPTGSLDRDRVSSEHRPSIDAVLSDSNHQPSTNIDDDQNDSANLLDNSSVTNPVSSNNQDSGNSCLSDNIIYQPTTEKYGEESQSESMEDYCPCGQLEKGKR